MVTVPMSCYLNRDALVRKLVKGKKDVALVIDDIHLNDKFNQSSDIFEFLRIWQQEKGFYRVNRN